MSQNDRNTIANVLEVQALHATGKYRGLHIWWRKVKKK